MRGRGERAEAAGQSEELELFAGLSDFFSLDEEDEESDAVLDEEESDEPDDESPEDSFFAAAAACFALFDERVP